MVGASSYQLNYQEGRDAGECYVIWPDCARFCARDGAGVLCHWPSQNAKTPADRFSRGIVVFNATFRSDISVDIAA